MKIAVAAIERGDSRAMPQTPCPDVQPLLSRVPKPTRSPPTAITIRLVGICGTGSVKPSSAAESGAAIRPAMKVARQARSVAGRIDQAGKNSGHAGDAAVEQHQQNRGEPDQRAANGGGDGCEIGHSHLPRDVKPTDDVFGSRGHKPQTIGGYFFAATRGRRATAIKLE